MAKNKFVSWLLIGIATALVFGGIVKELLKSEWNLVSIGFLVLIAYIIYEQSQR